MKQTTYSCPYCQKKDKPAEQISISLYKCPICKEVFPQKDLKGHEINKIDYAAFWREEKKRASEIHPLRGALVDGIENMLKKKDIDNQMDSIVQESTDNLLHEIIMVRIYNKKPKETEETESHSENAESHSENKAMRTENAEIRSEETAVKTEIDKIFDIILGKI